MIVGARMLADRVRLRRVPGLAFAKVLGTGRGGDVGPSVDLRRQAYLLVWDDAEAATRFLVGHRLSTRWRSADVQHEGALAFVGGHGSWSGRAFLDEMRRVDPGDGPVVVLTRARVKAGAWRAFRRAGRAMRRVAEVPGVEWVVGVGELPVGLLGTLSRWESTAALDRFVDDDPVHAQAVRHGRAWFSESMFARFAPIELAGIRRSD